MQKGMVRTREVRERLGITRQQIDRYRRIGLFSYEPIAVRHGQLGHERVYSGVALTHLELLESLRKAGFALKAMRVLFMTMSVSSEMRDYISFDDKARIVITPEKLELAKQIIEDVLKNYDRGSVKAPQGQRTWVKG